ASWSCRRLGLSALAWESDDPRHPGCGGHRVREDARWRPAARRGVPGLPHEADQRRRLRRPGRPVHPRRRPGDRAMSDRGRVLVADDLPQNVRLLEAILCPLGYSVATASSGAEALAKIAASPPDIVLLDVVMPDIDGYEVCRRLRADPAT